VRPTLNILSGHEVTLVVGSEVREVVGIVHCGRNGQTGATTRFTGFVSLPAKSKRPCCGPLASQSLSGPWRW
jgi:hypothetical protein